MKRKNILSQLKLEMEDNLPNNVLDSVKNVKVKKDLTPVYEEINSPGVVSLKTNAKFITGFMVLAVLLFSFLLIILPLLNKVINPKSTIVSKLGIDINPSIDLMLDENDEVVLCLAKNKHAEILLNGENFVGKPVGEVTKQIITLATKAGYITTEQANDDIQNAVLITAICEDESKQENLLNSIKNEVKNFYMNNQIYGVVLTEFSSKQELVDLVNSLNYDLSETEKEELKNYSVKKLNEILSESYTQLKRRFRSDFIIEELNKRINPIYEEYENVKNEIDLKLKEVETEFANFEQIWQQDTELCRQKIAMLESEIAVLNEQIEAEEDPIILAKLQIELEKKQLFLLSEQKELSDRENGSAMFNAVKNDLVKEINKFKEQLEQKENEYLQKVETELVKVKDYVDKLDAQIENKKDELIKTYEVLLDKHLNALDDYNDFYNDYTNWLVNVAPKTEQLEKDWNSYKEKWETQFANYINF